jgi:hypothetical protein
VAYYRWVMAARAESGAVAISHPWEAGRDNAPDWDEAMAGIDPVGVAPYTRRDTGHVDARMRPTQADYDRYIWLVQFARDRRWDEAAIAAESPFRVADPTMTFTTLRSTRDLRRAAELLGEDTGEIDGWIARLEEGAARLWNPEIGTYDALNLRTGNFAGSVSNASFLCWWAGLEDRRPLPTFNRVMGAARFGIPSQALDAPSLRPLRYWRGPVWAVMNYMAGNGMAEQGLAEEAARVRADTARLIVENGFAEYFSPEDGTPAGGATFTWTAAVWLAWASPSRGGCVMGRDRTEIRREMVRRGAGHQGGGPVDRGRGIRDLRRPLGLREVHAPADDRGAGGDLARAGGDRRARRHGGAAVEARGWPWCSSPTRSTRTCRWPRTWGSR